jgi:hypothetical protein
MPQKKADKLCEIFMDMTFKLLLFEKWETPKTKKFGVQATFNQKRALYASEKDITLIAPSRNTGRWNTLKNMKQNACK